MKLQFLVIFLFFLSCSTKQEKKENATQSKKDTTINTEIIETFVDSLNIGEKGKSKIEIIKHRVFESVYVIINFYTKGTKRWLLQNTYFYEGQIINGIEPEITDFNNDKFNDFTYRSAMAARGANEIRRLFIYDNDNEKLISIHNSEGYPNMQYNEELDCVDAFLVYGGTSTVFARIVADSLKTFASVDNDQNRTVIEIDNLGNRKIIQKDTIIDSEGVGVRYKNYKPLKKYKDSGF